MIPLLCRTRYVQCFMISSPHRPTDRRWLRAFVRASASWRACAFVSAPPLLVRVDPVFQVLPHFLRCSRMTTDRVTPAGSDRQRPRRFGRRRLAAHHLHGSCAAAVPDCSRGSSWRFLLFFVIYFIILLRPRQEEEVQVQESKESIEIFVGAPRGPREGHEHEARTVADDPAVREMASSSPSGRCGFM